ncbi:MAG: hypothetical protein AUJ92_19430 [Armatimonadetes bacterium CG2_30_59_28]|nr:MAG: hypothetical protein AUJ92_19430 [Armatimonadetes bacterium CG2_30_59_28]PIU65218.1 MAG: hypothetical protein COS85_09635 [Armatimonadetes bacterium CG07_land_8_20_14_0_80_59_28]PIX43859.1 MAG: hypothetical protein COZ56_06125 [Armatimonadetes bacterium CG_4_8_14_3_um_filter_58_9]PIY49535.1 MAG: hypothetical protein COZ05_00120 [Armatimonadetes bacterium CG_4_10_14_3_um_filter_59_10]PJB65304.1 MAG: hypothetical protein CO095_14230 [Armatimonadetes bacterium CG_4_9_14_3_um_filter_58_7]
MPPDGQSTAAVTLNTSYEGAPLPGLEVTFEIVKILDARGQTVYDVDTGLDLRGNNNYGSLSPEQATTDAAGNATATYTAGREQRLQ